MAEVPGYPENPNYHPMRDPEQETIADLRARLAAVEGLATELQQPCAYGHRQFVNEGVPPYDEICAVCREKHRAEMEIGTLVQERSQADRRAEAAEQQRDTAIAQVDVLKRALNTTCEQLDTARTAIRAMHKASPKYDPWVPCDCEWCKEYCPAGEAGACATCDAKISI